GITDRLLHVGRIALGTDRSGKPEAADAADDTDDLPHVVLPSPIDATSDGIFSWEEAIGGVLTDDRDEAAVLIGRFGEVAPTQDRDAHRLEVAGRHRNPLHVGFPARGPRRPTFDVEAPRPMRTAHR